jgi:predicted kinase
MRAFSREGLWDRLAAAGALRASHIDALVAVLAGFHRRAAVAGAASPFGRPKQVRAAVLLNLRELQSLVTGAAERERLEELGRWEASAFAALKPAFAERLRDGWIRECHGDLHLGNVTQIDGKTTVFDCLEFSEDFRWIDVMSELAFMVMDLRSHGLPALANRFINGCLELSGDYAGVRVLRYYLAHRALVRAKVAALRAAQANLVDATSTVRRYLEAATEAARAAPPALLITHGASGSGKTTLTQSLLEAVGAMRIRADVERKRLHGLDALARAGPSRDALYSAEATAATYARLLDAAGAVLDGGCSVVLDATFLRRRQRDAARQLAASRGLRFAILDFAADADTLQRRVRERALRDDDASDADTQVLEAQLQSAEPLAADEREAVFECTATMDATGLPQVDWARLIRELSG